MESGFEMKRRLGKGIGLVEGGNLKILSLSSYIFALMSNFSSMGGFGDDTSSVIFFSIVDIE